MQLNSPCPPQYTDLLTELQAATFKVDVDLEKKLVAALLSQLEDSSGEIGGLAVKCLGLIIKKVHESQSDGLVRSLCDKVLSSKKENHRDIASIALKTIILEIPERGTLATNTATIIASKMLEGSSNKSSSEVACECLDILCELLARFGSIVPTDSRSSIQQCTLAYLNDTKVLLRKRAMHCLAAVSVHLTDQTLSLVITELLDQLSSKSGSKQDIIRVYIQTVGLVSRSIGYRFGPHLPLAVPSIIK
jgi:cullin-associated NEDD8-dissociated protein 1